MSTDPLRVALRADASAQIGLGHVKRSLALGQALQAAGARVCLVARDLGIDTAPLAGALEIEHFGLCRPPRPGPSHVDDVPHAAWAQVGWAADAEETAAILRDWRADLVVVDHYAFDARWHDAVRSATGARIAAIDDLADRSLHVDWVIDHNHSHDPRAKYAGRLTPAAKLMCGPRFALLGPVYATAPRHALRERVESIGIFMGGADNAGASGDAVRACREAARFGGSVEVVTTGSNPHLDELRATCSLWPNTTLSVDLPDLATFFARHDLQIGAGGGATWERCCIGAPTLALVCADNQHVVIPALERLGVLATPAPAGDRSIASIGRALAALIGDFERRSAMSLRARALVDGLGARRVALRLTASTLALRGASAADAPLMHAWRNSPVTRALSHDRQEITWPEHVQWLDRTLADPTRLVLIAHVGAIPIGVIRFDRRTDGEAAVSLYLDPDLRGLGLGTAMLRAGEQHVLDRPGAPAVFAATVLGINADSQRMFRFAGYRQDGEQWTKTASLPATVRAPT